MKHNLITGSPVVGPSYRKRYASQFGTLTAAAFDGYFVDLRLGQATYYVAIVKGATREAQALVPGYTYKSFCEKVKRAGCAGYLVSLLGRSVLYFGRTGETHTEHFPGTQTAVTP